MAYNKFAESVINGSYKRKEPRDNTSSQSSNSFADSVINGTYKKIEIDTTPRQIVTSPPVQINTERETIPVQSQSVIQPTTEPQKTPLVYEGASINPNASEEEKLKIIANNNLRQKKEAYDTAYENLKSKRKEELTKQGISTDPMVKYNEATLDERLTKPNRTEANKLGEESRKYISSREDIENATQNESKNLSNANNQLKYAKYLKNVSDVQQEGTDLYDQTIGHLVRGAQDILSNFSEDNRFVDENGNVQYLPSYNALKQQKVQESYGDGFLGGLARFAGDVGYQGGKIGASVGLNALAPYSGTALYFSDIYGDQYQQNINEGMDNETAMLNAFAKTGQNYIKQKLIGGIGGKLTGGDSSWLEKTLSSEWAKVASDPRVVSILSSMSAEALDEFTDTYMETLIDAVSKKDSNLGDLLSTDTLLEALYGAAVGGATGAAGGFNANSLQNAQNAINQRAMGNINNQQNITPQNTNAQIQPETPQIQTNQENNINNQSIAETPNIEPKQANNEQITKPEQLSLDLSEEQPSQQPNAKQITDMDLQLGDNNNPQIIVGRQADVAKGRSLNEYKIQTGFLTKDAKQAIKDYGGVEKLWRDSQTMKPTEIANNMNKQNNNLAETKSEDVLVVKKIQELKDKQVQFNKRVDSNPQLTQKEKNSKKYGYAMQINAEIRKLQQGSSLEKVDGGLTAKELERARAKEQSNYIGKQVLVDGKEGTIKSKPSYGKYKVEFKDGTTSYVMGEDIQQLNNKAELSNKVTNKETSKKVSTYLNEAINGNNTQNIKQTIKSIEEETGKKMRSWVETATTSTGTTELVDSMNKQKITYEPTSNKKNLDAANKELSGMNYEQKLAKAKEIINSDKRLNSTDIAVLETVIQEAQTSGKMNDFMDLVQDTAILGTESGQVVQALSLIRQSDPTTQLSTLQKLIEKEQAKGNKIYDGVKIKEDLVENVINSYNEDGTWSKEKFDNAMYQLKQDIIDQMNVRPSEKFTAWRYLSMLGNPKTHIRNIVANVFMKLLQEGKDKVASGIESITPMNALNNLLNTKVKWKGLKTEIKKGNTEATKGHTLSKSTQEVKNYANTTIDNYFNEHKQTSKYNDNIRGLKSELESQRKIFSEKTPVGKVLNKLEKANANLLNIEDDKFNRATTRKAFANFLTANGIETQEDIDNNPELVAQGLDYALFKGNEATFHQYSATGTALRNARESLRQGSNLSRIGGLAMDATMPFINTPINIAKTGIEYTPGIGMIKTISDVKNAPKDLKADVFIDSLSKQFAGGALAALGFALAQQGIINAKGGEDKEDKLEKNLGKQDYSINILGQTFDLSWLSPSAMPLFVGAELQKATNGKGISPEMAMNLLTSTIDPLSEMSVISSVTDALKSYSQGTQALGDIGSSALTSYISQFVPTLAGQIATVFDETQRSSSGNTLGEKIVNQIKYKIPGLRNTLPAQVDVWGNEKKYASDPVLRAFEAFVSPANRKEVKIDDTTKEIERVYENTGSGIPSLSITKTPKIDNETYNLNSKEYIQYKKDYGKNAKDMLDDLVKQDKYKNADDAEKASMISAIYQYSTYMARKKIAEENNMKYEYKQSDGKGYNFPKYYLSLSKDEFAKYVANKYDK